MEKIFTKKSTFLKIHLLPCSNLDPSSELIIALLCRFSRYFLIHSHSSECLKYYFVLLRWVISYVWTPMYFWQLLNKVLLCPKLDFNQCKKKWKYYKEQCLEHCIFLFLIEFLICESDPPNHLKMLVPFSTNILVGNWINVIDVQML